MKRRILICDSIDLASFVLPVDLFEIDYSPKITAAELSTRIGGYDAIVVRSRTKIDATLIRKATKLKIIARPGSGLDNIDTRAANARGVEVVNSPEALVEAVAEHVIGLMLAQARRIPQADASTRSGQWLKEKYLGVELRGRIVGIVGLGRIGRRVGEIANVLGMSAMGYDIVEIGEDILRSIGCRMVDLDTLFASSDFITLNVPLSSETRHLVDERRLRLMKKDAYLVNTSRGEVIEEGALVKALREGALAGAALDVFETEPPSREMLSAPNLVATPHIGGQTSDAQRVANSAIAAKIAHFFLMRDGKAAESEDLSSSL